MIPRYIPIPEVSIDDHVKKTANDLLHLLLHKSPPIPALQPESSRQAIIKLAQILGRDTTPPILPILQNLPILPLTSVGSNTSKSTSEGVEIRSTTTEGGKSQEPSVDKPQTHHHTLDDLLLKYNLLDARKPTTHVPRKQHNFTNLPPISQDSLLTYNIPTPKMYNRQPPVLPYPIPARRPQNKLFKYQYDAPTKSWAVKELMVQCMMEKLNHIFDTNGHKESIDSLLQGSQA